MYTVYACTPLVIYSFNLYECEKVLACCILVLVSLIYMYCIIASISITVLCCILVLDCVHNYISDKLSKPYVFNMAANKRFIIFYIFCWFICLWDYLVYKTQTTKFDPVFYSAIFVIIIVILLNICFIFYGDLCRNIRIKRLKQLNEQLCTIKNA